VTGQDVEAVSSVRREDGEWHLRVEILELSRIPPSTDVLGTYEVVLDENNELVSYSRVARYYRCQQLGD
jgi:hypothetical protein